MSEPVVRILFVDDEPNVLKAMRRLFRKAPWQQSFADSGREALELMEESGPFDVVVSDQRMPGMTGAELLKEVRTRHPETIRIILSGYADFQSILDAINEGSIYKFLTKPWDDEALRNTLTEAVEVVELRRRCVRLEEEMEHQNSALLSANQLLQEYMYGGGARGDPVSVAHQILEALPVGVAAFDEDGANVFVNRVAQQLLCAAGSNPLNAGFGPSDVAALSGVTVLSDSACLMTDGTRATICLFWRE